MRLAALVVVTCLPGPALAMNWEGHDDWMETMEPSRLLEEAAPHARPRPGSACPVTSDAAAQNPYEQIPLPHHNCPPRPEKAEPGR